MTPRQRANLLRLLNPRHVAVIGGRDAQTVAGECRRIGYAGPFWPVNPHRSEIGGHPCFASVRDLPQPPDAVFLAIPRPAAIATLAELNEMGAGGVVCYTAGFGETGAEGAEAEAQLVAAAGDMALVGPNCYGLINYAGKVALWPFAHGGRFPGYGAAIITQSGMLSSDLTISQRSVPFAYMVSAGNQSVLRLEDFVDVLSEQPDVRAIGLHIEGLKDVRAFEAAALKALERGIPIVALKTGSSSIGAELAISHTGSLSGTDDLYKALFNRLGIIRVTSPAQLLETVKYICVAGLPRGTRVAGFTCSGGGAALMADTGEAMQLQFPRPRPATAERLGSILPHTATVSNPLDYTTPIWGKAARTGPVFKALLDDAPDATVLIQDYPPPGLDDDLQFYHNDALAFVEAVKAAGIPGAVCATLPENIDAGTREMLISHGVAPMQGLPLALAAIRSAAWHAERRSAIMAAPPRPLLSAANAGKTVTLDEASAKHLLAQAGLPVPRSAVASGQDAPDAAVAVGFPIALKMTGEKLAHKTEAGAVRLNLSSAADVAAAVQHMQRDVAAYDPDAVTDRFLIEQMIAEPVAELMISVRQDAQFGYAMTLASGGILVELAGDATTLLLPASRSDMAAALDRLRITRLIDGYRGRPRGDRPALLDALETLSALLCSDALGLTEVEINPLFVLTDGVAIADALIQRAGHTDQTGIFRRETAELSQSMAKS